MLTYSNTIYFCTELNMYYGYYGYYDVYDITRDFEREIQ